MWSLDKLLKQYMGINLVYKYAIVHTDCVLGSTVRHVTGENEKRDKEKEREQTDSFPSPVCLYSEDSH